jgi:Tfp pilus assembly protein PilV
MMKKMRSRLRSQKGESIAEVLVAVLVSMVALTMLALMITATTKMVIRSRAKMDEYVMDNNELVEKDGAALNGTASFYLVKDDSSKKINLTDTSVQDIPTRYYVNDSLGNVTVISYKKGTTS